MASLIRCALVLHMVLLAISLQEAKCQTERGTVVDSTGHPLELVSVIILQDTTFIAATTTNDKGYFELPQSLKKKQSYTLHLTLVNYSPLTVSFVFPGIRPLRKLILSPITKTLTEVSVTAKLPVITRRTDRYIINVENSILANGLTATEVLQRSPGIWVDNGGNIRLKGTQTVTVMINRVIQRMSADELSDYLRSLKSEDISRIEVIPTPPAEFEAEGSGGIVQIFLKKGRKSGWSGSANAQYWWQHNKPYLSSSVTLNYQLPKLNLSATYGYVKDLRSITEKTDIIHPDQSEYHNSTMRNEDIRRQQYRVAAVYEINSKHSVSVESLVSTTKFDQRFLSDEKLVKDTTSFASSRSEKKRDFKLHGITMNYSIELDTAGSTLRFILDYSSIGRAEKNYFFDAGTWRTDAPTDTKIQTAQADYTKVINKAATFKAGVKYGSISRDNMLTTEQLSNNNWIIDSGRTNHFTYTENLLMAYSAIERTIQSTTVNVGIRAEQTFSKGYLVSADQHFSREYFGIFPSLFVLLPVNAKKGATLSFAYNRRLTRPAMNDLNPARMVFSRYTALVGNPNILPEYSNNFSVTYVFVKNHSVEVYFSRTRDAISLSVKPGVDNSIDYYSANTGSASQYGISYSGSSSPSKAWTITNNLSAYRSDYTFGGVAYKQTSFSASSVHVFSFDKFADVDVIAEYRSPYIYTNLYTYGNFELDFGVTKKLVKDKVRVRLACTDLLNTFREKELTNEKGTRLEFYRKRPTRTLRLSLTYHFSKGKKMADKKIDHSSADEKSRGAN